MHVRLVAIPGLKPSGLCIVFVLQPAFIPTYKTVSAAQSPGCKLYPEVIMNGGVPGASITFEPGLWLLRVCCEGTFVFCARCS